MAGGLDILNPMLLALLSLSVLVIFAAVAWLALQGTTSQAQQVTIAAPSGPLVSEGRISDAPGALAAVSTATHLPASPTAPPSPTQPPPTDTPQPTSTALLIVLPTVTPIPTATPTPLFAADPLTGLPVTPNALHQRPYIVMIDNHPDAAPQSGLDKTAMVFEALAEGGITRFMAVFDGSSPDASEIGPVRSARAYYIDWANPFHALYVHAGGSPAALDLLWNVPLVNTDLLSTGPSWRGTDRLAPHNLYTSSPMLKDWMAKQGTASDDTFQNDRLLHKDDNPNPNSQQKISFDFGSVSRSDVVWAYDAGSNSYLRWMWGQPHTDLVTGQQLSARNVIIIFTSRADIIGDDKGRIEVGTTGTGDALFAMDGTVTAGKWQKDSAETPLQFFDQSGTEMRFNRGNTWVEVLPIGQKVSY